MKRVLPMILIPIFLVTMFIVPQALVGTSENLTLQDLAAPAQVSRDARIAVYDEDNVTVPTESAAENLTNHISALVTLLENAGHEVTELTTADILNHELSVADYDIFVMVNNVPRENIGTLVKDYWLGGGALLSFNSAMSYLWYQEIIYPGVTGDPRYIAWDYRPFDTQNVTVRHSTMKDYHINDTVIENAGNWAIAAKSIFSGSDIVDDYIFMLANLTEPNFVSAFSVENSYRGGRIVQLPGDGQSFTTSIRSIIFDSVDWLVPRPKGRILFDLAHSPRNPIDSWDKDNGYSLYWVAANGFTHLRNYLVNHTYVVDKLYPTTGDAYTSAVLAKYEMLIVAWPDLNFTDTEITTLTNWVTNGGTLLVLGDRTGLGGNGYIWLNELLADYDISLGTTDVMTYVTATPVTHYTTEGTTSLEVGYRNYLSVIGDGFDIWEISGNPVVAGQEYGQGRVILSGDMNIFDNTQLMNNDNERFLLNVANWFTAGSDADLLLFTDYTPLTDDFGYHAPVTLAANELGLSYYLTMTRTAFLDILDAQSWDLVVVDIPNSGPNTALLDALYSYVDSGRKLLMCNYDVDFYPTHPLWSKIGIEYSSDITTADRFFVWDEMHEIFNEPFDYGLTYFNATLSFGDDGDLLTVTGGSVALAGYAVNETADNALIVLNSAGTVLYNGFLFDMMAGDIDDSTYEDRFELWTNELAFMVTTGGGTTLPFDLLTLAIIGGVALVLIIIIVLVVRRRSSTPAPKPKKKSTKKK
ncbi:MAG: hypothetical protein JW779_05900 [Candidatus Thorarchaeota archaeon]|nr:hypothetical protein [Candidatus Thorarchaeota archaeon]